MSIDFNELGDALRPDYDYSSSNYKDARIKALEARVKELLDILDKVTSEYNYLLTTYNNLLDDTK